MNPRLARIVAVVAATVLVALVASWAWWPSEPDRADLATVAPLPTSTTAAAPPSTAPGPTSAPLTATTTPPPAGVEPVRVRIPAIGVDATVVPVGLAPDRQMEIPAAVDVGWYRLGPRPGAQGSAVLAAHIDFGGQPGAFFDLGSVPIGAEILVDGPTGTERFAVVLREQVAKDEVDLSRYFTAEGDPRLTLITCGGAFSASDRHYEDNLILTAVPQP